MKNMTELSLEIARREAGKKEVSIAQIKEILAILSDIFSSEEESIGRPKTAYMMTANGRRRARRRK